MEDAKAKDGVEVSCHEANEAELDIDVSAPLPQNDTDIERSRIVRDDTEETLAGFAAAKDEGTDKALVFLLDRMRTASLRWPLKQFRRNFFMKHAIAYHEKERKRASDKAEVMLARRRSLRRMSRKGNAEAEEDVAAEEDPHRTGPEWLGPNEAQKRLRNKAAEVKFELAQQRMITRQAQARGEFGEPGKKEAEPTKTKRRLAVMFKDALYISSMGSSPTFKSGVPRNSVNTLTELQKPMYEEVGPGYYQWAAAMEKVQQGTPGHHLSEIPRFLIDPNSAEIKTELELPGTEHMGPGKYVIDAKPPPKGGSSLKRTAPRSYLEDPATVLTEGARNDLVAPGCYFVPQDHLFWNQDGTAKISENPAVAFPKDGRFNIPPEERLKLKLWAERPDLEGLDEYHRIGTWERNGRSLYSGHRIAYLSSGPSGFTLPLDHHDTRERHLSRRQDFLRKRSRSDVVRLPTPAQCSTPAALPADLGSVPRQHGRYKAVVHTKFKRCDPGDRWSERRSAAMRAKIQHGTVPRGEKGSGRRASDVGSTISPPRCADHIYRRRCDTPLQEPAVSDGFLGTQHDKTIEHATWASPEKTANMYHSAVPRTPETNLLHMHQPSILTNGDKLGPGSYDIRAPLAPSAIKKRRAVQKQAWKEFRTGCPQFKEARDGEALDCFRDKNNPVMKNMAVLFA